MNINEYSELGKSVEVPDIVMARFDETMADIKNETVNVKPNLIGRIVRFAAIAAAVLLFASVGTLSVRAYIKHIYAIKNMPDDEVISLYENIYQYYNALYSRNLTEKEQDRENRLFNDYFNDIADPNGKVPIIDKKSQYSGKGIAFCKEDGLLYLPDRDLTDEEILECIEFGLIGHYVDYERYEEAINPDHYMKALRALNDAEIEELYVNYAMGGTEYASYSRKLTTDELNRKKVLKKLFKVTDTKPEKQIAVIAKEVDYVGSGVAFCTYNCTYILPEGEMTDEDILEVVDYEIKQVYAINRITEEVNDGIRIEYPNVEVVKRDRVETLDKAALTDEELLDLPWIKAYGKVVEERFDSIRNEIATWPQESISDYYCNICFIYLNDDDIPEMLFTRGYTPMDTVNDLTAQRVLLYTFKDGEAIQLKSFFGETEGFYAQFSPFRYAERKSMVYDEGHYMYRFEFKPYSSSDFDNINDTITIMDYWDLDSLTCAHTDMNIELKHAVYDYEKETYEDAEIFYDYYIGVKEITRDDYSGIMDEIKGRKVDKATFNAANEALWNGEQYRIVEASDYDKIYSDYDPCESLVKCYKKQLKQ